VPHPCALTAVPTHGFGFVDGIVEINLLALRDGAKRRKEVLKADLPAMSSYGAHIRAGELVFCSGLMPIAADGRVPGSQSLDALAHGAQTQAQTVLSYAERISKGSIVRAQWFMTDVRDFAGVQLAWARRQENAPHPFVCVQVPGELPAPRAALTADFWIYAP
jgi:enamine deaminase RidA (YjgF/YER057c/UK114 family)